MTTVEYERIHRRDKTNQADGVLRIFSGSERMSLPAHRDYKKTIVIMIGKRRVAYLPTFVRLGRAALTGSGAGR